MRSQPYLEAGEAHLPPPEATLGTLLAVVGIFVPIVAACAWRYAINEIRNIDEGSLRSERRRSLDHARSLAKITTLAYGLILIVMIAVRA